MIGIHCSWVSDVDTPASTCIACDSVLYTALSGGSVVSSLSVDHYLSM